MAGRRRLILGDAGSVLPCPVALTHMPESIQEIVSRFDPAKPLTTASTIPGPWYTDAGIAELERKTVFSRTWQMVGRAEQVAAPGQYITAEVGGEPVVVVRGADKVLRAFFNVCRHHAAAVMTAPAGSAPHLRCPYHGWTYGLDGTLKGVPEFDGVCHFDRAKNGLVPISVETWENFVLVNLDPDAPPIGEFLGNLPQRVAPLNLAQLHFVERRVYSLQCNWKVYVDNY